MQQHQPQQWVISILDINILILNHKESLSQQYTDNTQSMYTSQSLSHTVHLCILNGTVCCKGSLQFRVQQQGGALTRGHSPSLSCINCNSECERSHPTSGNSTRGFWRISHADGWRWKGTTNRWSGNLRAASRKNFSQCRRSNLLQRTFYTGQ